MDFFLGHVFLVPFDSVPDGTLPCDGRLLAVNSYQALFALLSNRFGGNGTTTFGLPDLRSITPPGMMYVIVISGIFPSQA